MIEFYECDHCGARFRHEPHQATRKNAYEMMAGAWIDERRLLCCACYEQVGGKCDGHDD